MGCHKWDIRAEKCEIVTPALWKNLVFQLVSAKICPRKTFGSRKFQPRSIRTLPMQLSNKQMDPLNTIVEKERRNKEMQRAMGNVESVSKKFKNFSFFWQKLAGKLFLAKTITTRRSTEWCSIDECKNITNSKLTVKTGLKNIPSAKSPKSGIFIANNSPQKNSRRPKVWNKLDFQPVVVFMQKSDKSDQSVPRKLDLKRWNAEGCHGREKTKPFWRVLVRKSFAPLA